MKTKLMHFSSVSDINTLTIHLICNNIELGFSQTEKFNWRQLIEHTDINQVIAGSVDQLDALQPGLAHADLQKDLGKLLTTTIANCPLFTAYTNLFVFKRLCLSL